MADRVSIRVHAASLPRDNQKEAEMSQEFQSASMRPVSRESVLQTRSRTHSVSIRVHAASLPRDERFGNEVCFRGFNPRPCGQSPERGKSYSFFTRDLFQSASMRPVSRETREEEMEIVKRFQSASMRPVSREPRSFFYNLDKKFQSASMRPVSRESPHASCRFHDTFGTRFQACHLWR